jgi:hypothetical protein
MTNSCLFFCPHFPCPVLLVSVKCLAHNLPSIIEFIQHQVVRKRFFSGTKKIKLYYSCSSCNIYRNKFSFRFWWRRLILTFTFFKIGNPFFNGKRSDFIVDEAQHGKTWMKSFTDISGATAVLNSTDIRSIDDLFNGFFVAALGVDQHRKIEHRYCKNKFHS